MTLQSELETEDGNKQRRGRGQRKLFPVRSLEEVFVLPKSILDYGVGGEIQRLTLLDKLQISPNSSKTRELIASSAKYKLTVGNYNTSSLTVTDDGRALSGYDPSNPGFKEKGFNLAIDQFKPFNAVYERLKDKRLPDSSVLRDEFKRAGVATTDCGLAGDVFTANLRFLGLVHDISGSDYVRSFEQAIVAMPDNASDSPPEPPTVEPPVENMAPPKANQKDDVSTKRPTLHIDIQVHIDPTSSPEQIDHIFASMARHLYGREG